MVSCLHLWHLRLVVLTFRRLQITMPENEYEDYVIHPRYGQGPRITGLTIANLNNPNTPRPKHFILDTAVRANIAKLPYTIIAIEFYHDLKRVCRICNQKFIFFAEEQQYWYEDLKLPLHADAINCVKCRRETRKLKNLKLRYDDLIHQKRTPVESYELIENAIVLIEEGVFTKKIISNLKYIIRSEPDMDVQQTTSLIQKLNDLAQKDIK